MGKEGAGDEMETLLVPVLWGCAGFVFGSWVLSSDARRMGIARPTLAQRLDVKSGPGKTLRILLCFGAIALVIAGSKSVRRIALLIVSLLCAKRVLNGIRRRKRASEMRREWPCLVESMAVAALSGMETGAAFMAAARRVQGALREETDKVTLRMIGGAPLSRALAVCDEVSIPEVKRFRSVLAQSEILGTPVAGILRTLSDEGYEAERQTMEERFNTLPLVLSAITVFFLLPPVLAVSIIPHVLAFLESRW